MRVTAYPLCKVAESELALKCKQGLELYLNRTHKHMHVKHPKPRHNTSRYDKGSWEDSKNTQKVYCEATTMNFKIIFKNFYKSLFSTQLRQCLQNTA